MTVLQERAKNCIATLLELSPFLKASHRPQFAAEFAQLEGFIAKIEKMAFAEEDVLRLEDLTRSFMREFGLFGPSSASAGKRQ